MSPFVELSFPAFLKDDQGRGNTYRDIPSFAGSIAPSTVRWINDAGEIVGFADLTGDQVFHGFLWKNGVIIDLGTVQGDPCSLPNGINSKGQVVGGTFDCNGAYLHAFLWENGRISDLNAFNPPGSTLQQLIVAYNINDSGEIDGLGVPPGVDPKDVFTLGHAFVLIPCDENHPGVEGCDYSMVDTTALPQVPALPGASTPTSGQPFLFPRARFPFRNHIPLRTLVKTGIDGEAATGQPLSRATSNVVDDDVVDGLTPFYRGGNQGYCLVDSKNKLTGACIGNGGQMCVTKYDPAHCPPGKTAIAPTNYSCQIRQVTRVDGARRCTDH